MNSSPSNLAAMVLAAVLLGCCSERFPNETPRLSINEIEQIYQQTRDLGDQIQIGYDRAITNTADYADLKASYFSASKQLEHALSAEPSPPISEEDGRALIAMRQAFENDFPDVRDPATKMEDSDVHDDVNCRYDAESLVAGDGGFEALTERIYKCYSKATKSLSFEGEQLDDITAWARLPLTPERARRESLWRSFMPMWKSVNGDNGPRSPYRVLVRANAVRMKDEGEVLGESVRGIGVEPVIMEQWLIRVLEKWRDITPGAMIEPWDFDYGIRGAERALSDAISAQSLLKINDRVYRDLGADPSALHVRYDIEPRPSKGTLAFTTFGRRPRFEHDRWVLGEAWVFAYYPSGGFGNLWELLHETGHAIHISAIRTRPAFTDWPDSDIFTEGVADIAMLEMYEPAWQQRYLGRSVSVQDAIVGKYAYIMGDIAWAIFELRMYREPERDPNEVWGELCERYFRIHPHPELAWWAIRGQLILFPGYMLNYAAGAILAADLRVRARELCGPYTEGNPTWYRCVSERLYRFGLERTSKEVIEECLGRPVSPQAILDDMERAQSQNDSLPIVRSVDRALQSIS